MEIRTVPDRETCMRMPTKELRDRFLLEGLFSSDNLSMVYSEADRAVVGGAVPATRPLMLTGGERETASGYFTERRELGIANIGGKGCVRADGVTNELGYNDMLYIGRGVREIEFSSESGSAPAVFYFVSFPAHAAHPVRKVPAGDAEKSPLGSPAGANKRTISKYIHPGGASSCQLVMGQTSLETGSVWNTMPAHTHMRRSEIYLYYELERDAVVVHLMGQPHQVRSLIVRNRQAVLSPPWSIHSGVGTARYSFIWAMGGENQDFADMDPVAMNELQ